MMFVQVPACFSGGRQHFRSVRHRRPGRSFLRVADQEGDPRPVLGRLRDDGQGGFAVDDEPQSIRTALLRAFEQP